MSDTLDVNTPRGQQTLQDEDRAASIFMGHYRKRGLIYCRTPKAGAAKVDAVIADQSAVRGVVETKCRYKCKLDTFRNKWGNEWLVTFDKLEGGKNAADLLQVPFYGFLYIVDDDALLVKKIYDPLIGWVATFRVERTVTQATCNGGDAIRANAYIKMDDASLIGGDNCAI